MWQPPKIFPILKFGHIHIWRASLIYTEKEQQLFLGLLSSQEKERAAKYMVKHAASHFIVARGVLRILLARYLNVLPGQLVFHQNKYGKLYLEDYPVQFNLSHSQDLALFIFALNCPVGIDLEFIREDFDYVDIAKKFFAESEVESLFALPLHQQLQAFFNCWSRKEAFIKAIGTGMFTSLDKFSVEVFWQKNGPVRLTAAMDNVVLHPQAWSIEALDPADKYAGAFAARLSTYNVSFYDYQ